MLIDSHCHLDFPDFSADLPGVIARAKAAQADWAARPLAERIALVQAGLDALNGMKDRVVEELARQMGRPIRYGGEFGGMNERAAYMMRIAEKALAPEVIEDSPRFRRELRREPVGTVFVIAPWNYPFLTATNTIVPALIAGNAVILKHASQTLLAGERLAEASAAVRGVEDRMLRGLDAAERDHARAFLRGVVTALREAPPA